MREALSWMIVELIGRTLCRQHWTGSVEPNPDDTSRYREPKVPVALRLAQRNTA